MHTQCPHCDTRFRITETQVSLAEGFVRCSVCQEVFNALAVANQHDSQSSLLKDTPEDLASLSPIPSIAKETDNNECQQTGSTVTEHFDIKESPETKTSAKDSFDFFDEKTNESLSHVVPEKYRDSCITSASITSNLLWATGILLLTATLTTQYAWFNRNQLNQSPQIQSWFKKACQQFECKNISIRDPKKIELISRNVYSHPNQKKALMISVTMKNNADFAQPYPIMQVAFSDVRGGTVAARRFLPSEYFSAQPSNNRQQNQDSWSHSLFEPGTNMTFTMEIQDPGKQAMTYEFDFL